VRFLHYSALNVTGFHMFINVKERKAADEGKLRLGLRYRLNRLTGLANSNSGNFGLGYDALGRPAGAGRAQPCVSRNDQGSGGSK
jgi:hypothetical protein